MASPPDVRFPVVWASPNGYDPRLTRVPGELIRIFSDIHFGDRASRLHRLEQFRPLVDGVTHLVLNGDTLDTRPGPAPARTAENRLAVAEFFCRHTGKTTFVTGNHDADFSPHHYADLGGGAVFSIHGDILFDNLVPWSQDARLAGRRIAEELQRLPVEQRDNLDQRLAIFRRVAHSIPQRHQSEVHGLRYTLRYLADTVWPPHRILFVLYAWLVMPARAAAFARRYRPQARFIVTGHTHRAGIWRTPDAVTVINTGAFSPPGGALVVDLAGETLAVRRVVQISGEFRPGSVVAKFPLAAS